MKMSEIFNLNWSEDDINFLVKLYRNHECLWNHKKGSYKNFNLRKLAYDDIASRMKREKNICGFGVAELTNTIAKIQMRYNSLREIGNISDPNLSMCWYNDLDFIRRKNLETQNDNNTVDETNNTIEEESTDDIDKEVGPSATSNLINPQYGTKDKSTISYKGVIEIMNILKKLYIEKVPSNYKMVHHILTKILKSTDECLTSSVDTLAYHMTNLGYVSNETANGMKLLIEDPRQRFERYLYLAKIRKVKKNTSKPIVYIDERVINTHHKYQKFKHGGLPANSSLFYHAVTKEGLLHGLFCNKASEDDFMKWMTDIVLPLLKTPSLIVMDNGPLHGKLMDTCSITRYSTKQEVLNYLNSKNIPCSPNTPRPVLYEMVKKNKSITKEYKIDRLLRSHGHDVLRLPNSFPDLNLTDILWRAIADGDQSASIITKTVPGTENLQSKILNTILPSIDYRKWTNFVNELSLREREIFEIDVEIEDILESYSFKMNESAW